MSPKTQQDKLLRQHRRIPTPDREKRRERPTLVAGPPTQHPNPIIPHVLQKQITKRQNSQLGEPSSCRVQASKKGAFVLGIAAGGGQGDFKDSQVAWESSKLRVQKLSANLMHAHAVCVSPHADQQAYNLVSGILEEDM